jgi:hypothetical protein
MKIATMGSKITVKRRTKRTMRVMNWLIYRMGMIVLCLPLCLLAQAQRTPISVQQPLKPNEVTSQIGSIRDDLSLQTVSGTPKTIFLHGVRYRKSSVGQRLARVFLTERVLAKGVRVRIRGMAGPGVCYADVIPEGTQERNTKGDPLSLNEEIIRRGIANWEDNYVASRADLAVCEDEAHKSRSGFWGSAEGKGMTKESMTAPLTFSPAPASPVPTPETSTPTSASPVPISASPAPTPETSAPTPEASTPTPEINWLPWVLSGMLAMALSLQLLRRLPWRQWLEKRQRPKPKEYPIGSIVPLCDASAGPITVQGVVQVDGDTLQTPTGNHPCVYYHETVEVYRRVSDSPLGQHLEKQKSSHEWVCIRDEQDVCAFKIEDGSGEATVAAERAQIHATQVIYLYNDFPVGQFFENPYPDDTRTKISLLSPGALVTIQGRYEGGTLVSTAKGLLIREQDHVKSV